MKKSTSQLSHFKKRCVSRLGFELSNNTIQIIIKGIQSKATPEELFSNKLTDLAFVENQSNRITKWQIKYNDKLYYMIYDKQRKMVVTLLFPEEEYINFAG